MSTITNQTFVLKSSDILNQSGVNEMTQAGPYALAVTPWGTDNIAVAWIGKTSPTSEIYLFIANVNCGQNGIGNYTRYTMVQGDPGLGSGVALWTDVTGGTLYFQYTDGTGTHIRSTTDLTATPAVVYDDPIRTATLGLCGAAPPIAVLFYLRDGGGPTPSVVSLAEANGEWSIWDTGTFSGGLAYSLAYFGSPITYNGQQYGNAAVYQAMQQRPPLPPTSYGYVLPDYWGPQVIVSTSDVPSLSCPAGVTSWTDGTTVTLVEAFPSGSSVNLKSSADLTSWTSSQVVSLGVTIRSNVSLTNSGGLLYAVFGDSNGNVNVLQFGPAGS